MRLFHFIKRGKYYIFNLRVPSDLQRHFPKKTIWKSLRTTDRKQALVLVKSEEYRLQQLFMQLRSRMFPKELEQWLIASYMMGEIELIQAEVFAEPIARATHGKINKGIAADIDAFLQKKRRKGVLELAAEDEVLRQAFRQREPSPSVQYVAAAMVADYNKLHNGRINPTAAEMNSFGLKLMDASVRVKAIERAVAEDGNIHHLERARAELAEKLQRKYQSLGKVVEWYLRWYKRENPDVRTFDSEVVTQCSLLVELLGKDTPITDVNTQEMVGDLRGKLRKYPKNKTKIFGRKTLSTIVNSGVEYTPLSLRTADKYFSRLYSVLEFCIKEKKLIPGPNEAEGKSVSTKKERKNHLPQDQRKTYDDYDIPRLVDSLCTKPLSFSVNRDERFWLVLIAFLQSFRIGNIVGLTKSHIKSYRGIWCFDLGEYSSDDVKTAQTRNVFTPIHPVLVELGFLDWVKALTRERLFRDSVSSVSRWYNRNEIDKKTGKVLFQGFEARYITTDPKKCLYSSRHVFGTAGNEARVEMKILKDMMGHVPDGSDQTRGRYSKRSSPEVQQVVQVEMLQQYVKMGFDIERLKVRARQLFDLP